ncbi:MAG TPA: hypothetical protein PK765_03600 [bacterium]|nr:hypothetical protein [bacterium]
MLRTAEAVTRQYGGLFPDNTVALRALPGVGAYTAEAIRAFAYDLPTLAMDTNLVRIFSRYYFGAKTPSLPRTIEKTLLEQMQSENRS